MVVTKRLHILKQTCSWTPSVQLQVCLSVCDLFLPPGIKGLMHFLEVVWYQLQDPFSTYAKFPEKLAFLTPRYAHVYVLESTVWSSSTRSVSSDRSKETSRNLPPDYRKYYRSKNYWTSWQEKEAGKNGYP